MQELSQVADAAKLEQAVNLRNQGNDAFGSKDWDRALEFYNASVRTAETAKAYSNLAATLCKLSRYTEASAAAERATVLDPKWGKGWWRRGNVAELLKRYSEAHCYYSIAVDLEPNEKSFVKARKAVPKPINFKDYIDASKAAREPSTIAWRRFCDRNLNQSYNVYVLRQTNFPAGENPKSEQYLIQGLQEWSEGLRDAVANLTCQLVPQVNARFERLVGRGSVVPQELLDPVRNLLGGNPTINTLQSLSNAISHMGGLSIPMAIAPSGEQMMDLLCPQPAALSFLPSYQLMGILLSVHIPLKEALAKFGRNMKVLDAVLTASDTFSANLGLTKIRGVKGAAPREVVDFIKLQVSRGHIGHEDIRKFVSLMYRGSILYGFTVRLFGHVAQCYQAETAAREFIELADEEFKVSEEGTYAEKGVTFLESFRIGMLVSELHSLLALQAEGNPFLPGPFSILTSIDLCKKIIEMANRLEIPRNLEQPEYCYVQKDVAFRRKPLAIAHSTIAKQLQELQNMARELQNMPLKERDKMTLLNGLRRSEDEEAVIAEHYQRAAEAELHDARDKATFWWACASFIARSAPVPAGGNSSNTGSYTLGDLRSAVAKALEAEGDRDIGLFGPNELRGSMNETISNSTVDFFQHKPDSYCLPHARLVECNNVISLKIGDETICSNLEKTKEIDLLCERQQNLKLIDTKDVEKMHGTDIDHGLPSLETLCIRQLHKQGCEYAVGETDGAVIQYKALAAGWQQMPEK